jgi:hypothetical protein
MTEDTRLMAFLKKVKNIRQYVFSGRTAIFFLAIKNQRPVIHGTLAELLGEEINPSNLQL